jgi:hypothetical protein
MKARKLVLAMLGASVLFGALAGNASARTFSFSSQTLRRIFRAVTFNGAFGNIVCSVTLEGSLHSRTIPKVVGSLIGYITRADLGPCATGTATILRETLPWHLRYLGFTGTLPNITSIRENIVGFSARILEPFAACLARSTPESPVVLTFNVVERVLANGELGGSIPTSCGMNGTFSTDRGPVTVLNSSSRITVTLI